MGFENWLGPNRETSDALEYVWFRSSNNKIVFVNNPKSKAVAYVIKADYFILSK